MVDHRGILPVWIYWRQDWWQLEYKMADPYLLCFWQNSESLFGLRTCLWWYWCLCAGWTQKDKLQELSCSCFENSSLFSIMVLAMDSRVLLNFEITYMKQAKYLPKEYDNTEGGQIVQRWKMVFWLILSIIESQFECKD